MNKKGNSVPTDDEIKEMMDFDGLIAAYEKAMPQPNHASGWLKWGIGASVVVAISLSLYFSLKTTESKVITHEPIIDRQQPIETPLKKAIDPTFDSANQKSKTVASKKENKPPKSEEEEVVITQEYLAAEPVDGYPSLYAYFDRELKYPLQSVKDSVQGVESVAFIINKDGKPSKIEIQQSLGANFDQEVIRLIESMPPWKPATLNGKPVVSKISVPFTFRIESSKSK